ncbi:hypothetical protein ACQEVX_32465 [Streptomyces syringium]|uniref:hypothetical protein n=1 Tax=Streptomyces syringium TaxID=76729 RepID=UPI003D91979F
MTQSERLTRPAVAPHSGLVVFLKTHEGGSTFGVEARDARTGAVRWSSAQWKPGGCTAEIRADDVQLVVTSKNGKDFAALVAPVREGADAVDRGVATTTAAIFAADSAGPGIAPVREVKVPGAGTATPHDTAGTLAFANDTGARIVDVTTGAVGSRLDRRSREYLLKVNRYFRMDDAWPGQDVLPTGAQKENFPNHGESHGVRGGYVAAAWPSKKEDSSSLGEPMNFVWALHEEQTGKPVYALACDGLTEGGKISSESRAVLSDNGRYLVTGYVAFDLQAKKGYCFGGTRDQARVDFLGVDNAGTAYGTARTPGTGVPVSVDLATGAHTELGGATLPTRVTGDLALYVAAPQNEKNPAADPAHHAVLRVYPKR